jgi:REP element-mobilizing transposase RayT
MPRSDRIFVEGGVYHVYNRLGRGESVFLEEDEAAAFTELLRDVSQRDELMVFAWCLMSNHFHLAVRTGAISLDRPMRSLQQRVTRGVNFRRRVYGPLWQGRYRAKLVKDQRYLDQLLIYIHLNPVTAGIVDDPAEYCWSGHRELLGKVKKPIVDVDEVLRVFGTTRRSARAAYVRRLKGSSEEDWIGEEPGRLPWWRLGRPPKGEDVDPEAAVRSRRERERDGPEWRPHIRAEQFIARGAEVLGIGLNDLRSRRQDQEVARARELLMVLGVERYRLKVSDLARELRKSPDGMTKTLARATRKRTGGDEFRTQLDVLDQVMAKVEVQG